MVALSCIIVAQVGAQFSIPPGHVLVDDMILPQSALDADFAYQPNTWPGGIVPYVFDASFDSAERAAVLVAMAQLEGVANIGFRPKVLGDLTWLAIHETPSSESFAEVGWAQFSIRDMWLSAAALTTSPASSSGRFTIVHELMHILGVVHEHQRGDRDQYVDYCEMNVQSGTFATGAPFTSAFQILCPPPASPSCQSPTTAWSPYDFDSIMHYSPYALASGQSNCSAGTATLAPLLVSYTGAPPILPTTVVGQNKHLSEMDALGLVALYGPPAPPTISHVSVGTNGQVIVEGTRFRPEGLDAYGVRGSMVMIDGHPTITTYIPPDTSQSPAAPAYLEANSVFYPLRPCASVWVENPHPTAGAPGDRSLTHILPSATQSADARRSIPPNHYLVNGYGAPLVGSGVRGVGDLNNDGFDDFGASFALGAGSRILVCWSGISGCVLLSLSSGPHFCHAFAGAGDVNGDGHDDLLVSTLDTSSGSDSGLVEVVSGLDASVMHAQTGVPGSQFGFSLDGVGDLDGDGLDDYIVGAPGGAGTMNEGSATVFRGAPAGQPSNLMWYWNWVWIPTPDPMFGYSVARAGDVNGDGVPDYIIGSPGFVATGFGAPIGRAVVVSGSDGTWLHDIHGTSSSQGPDFVPGMGVGPAGDYDGDGFDDVIVLGRATGVTTAGAQTQTPDEVRVISGASGNALLTLSNDAQLEDLVAVAAAGDVNGDGLGDIAASFSTLGQPYPQPGEPGVFALISGGSGTIMESTGGAFGEQLGRHLAPCGDINGDGFDDVVLGAPGSPGATVRARSHAVAFQYGERLAETTLDLRWKAGPPGAVAVGSIRCSGAAPGATINVIAGTAPAFVQNSGVIVLVDLTTLGGLGSQPMYPFPSAGGGYAEISPVNLCIPGVASQFYLQAFTVEGPSVRVSNGLAVRTCH